ncbi:Pyridoxal phosphate-dependent transferase [Trinorchestia longiramus]|nr:Pyridoxal phosphate-dependent transferase [Trinorchestia longiramus]
MKYMSTISYWLLFQVYEQNIYDSQRPFYSFRKVVMEMEEPYSSVAVASFMSISKGFMGECGTRGGYVQFHNLDTGVVDVTSELLRDTPCPTPCQVLLDCAVSPPVPGDPSYELFVSEKSSVLDSLAQRARLVTDLFNSLPGVSCSEIRGSMFCFPSVHLPVKAIEAARATGQSPDLYYAYQLVERTGIVVLPGAFFGQLPGTYHFRMAILPPLHKLRIMAARFRDFHMSFLCSHQ